MTMKVLVVGATGMLGDPVARRLQEDDHRVRLLVRDEARAHTRFGAAFDYVEGSVTDAGAVERAVAGMDAVHISLGAHSLDQLEPVEHHGTASIAAAAARHGLRRI